MLHTTFQLLKLAGACGQHRGSGRGYSKLAVSLGGVSKYGKHTPIPLTYVLESNGLDDALWTLKATLPEEEAERDKLARLLACDYAEGEDGLVLKSYEDEYPGDLRVRRCIETARRFAVGMATQEELAAARNAARASARAAVRAARATSRDVAWATSRDVAWAVAWAAWAAARKWQTERFVAYLEGRAL